MGTFRQTVEKEMAAAQEKIDKLSQNLNTTEAVCRSSNS